MDDEHGPDDCNGTNALQYTSVLDCTGGANQVQDGLKQIKKRVKNKLIPQRHQGIYDMKSML